MSTEVKFLFWLSDVAKMLPGWKRQISRDGSGVHQFIKTFQRPFGVLTRIVVCDPRMPGAVIVKSGKRHTGRNDGEVEFIDIHGVPSMKKEANKLLEQIDAFRTRPRPA